MSIGKPGVVVITDNAGTWTAGIAGVSVNGNSYGPSYDTNKDTSMTNLAAAVAGDADVLSSVYSSGAHTITITPKIGKQLYVLTTTQYVTGTMEMIAETTPNYPSWATGASVEMEEPDSGEKAAGWVHDQKPPAHWFNWIKNLLYQWVKFFEDNSWENGECNLIFPDSDFTTEQTVACSFSYNKQGVVLFSIPTHTATSNSVDFASSNFLPNIIRPAEELSMPCKVISQGNEYLGAIRILTTGQVKFEVAEVNSSNIVHNVNGFINSGAKGFFNSTVSYNKTA
jgi:hypothetical protein